MPRLDFAINWLIKIEIDKKKNYDYKLGPKFKFPSKLNKIFKK